jgi:hypothetical protein
LEHILGAFDVVFPGHPGQRAQIQIGIRDFKSIFHNGLDWLEFFVPPCILLQGHTIFGFDGLPMRRLRANRNITSPVTPGNPSDQVEETKSHEQSPLSRRCTLVIAFRNPLV